MAQLAVGLLALFGQMERTHSLERAAHARTVATAKGWRVGRPTDVVICTFCGSPTRTRTC